MNNNAWTCRESSDWPRPPILFEDNHVLVVSKPARLPTMGVPAGQESLLTIMKDLIKVRDEKPGNVYLGVMSRLDAPVTGLVLIAKTSKAASRLTEQFKKRTVEKVYWALVEGTDMPETEACVNWLRKDERHRRVHLCDSEHPDAKEARLSYRVLRRFKTYSMLEVKLETGRKHQIRIQLGKRGHAILGDRKYGAVRRFPEGISLHARRVRFEHPTLREPVEIVAPLPAVWNEFGVLEEAARRWAR